MTINYPIKTMWRSFFCALVATVVLSVSPFAVQSKEYSLIN